MKKAFVIISVCFLLLLIFACGKKSTEAENQAGTVSEEQEAIPEQSEEKEEAEVSPFEAIEKITGQVKKQSENQAGGKIVASDQQTLTSVLPSLSGWKMQEPEYSKSTIGQVTVSEITTEYMMGDKKVKVHISDAGTASAILMPVKMALSMNVSHEDSDGFERVFTYKGHKGIEEYKKESNFRKVTIIYKDRYVIGLESYSDLTAKDLKEILSKLGLKKLK